MTTWILRALSGLVAMGLLALAVLKLVYGGGQPYPSVATTPRWPAADVETLANMDFPPGNVAVAANGRVFVNYHPFAKAERFGPTVFELKSGHLQPWPNEAAQHEWQGVFGMTVDRQQRLWLVEPAGLDHERTRLSAWDLTTNTRVFTHDFDPGVLRFAQDLRISPDGDLVFLADTGLFKFTRPAIGVFELSTGRLLLRLQEHPSTQPQDWTIVTPRGPHKLARGLVNFAVGVDGLELSPDGAWLYYAAMSHQQLYRVPVAALVDSAVSEKALARVVQALGPKPLSDGITLDAQGRVILTDVEHGGLMRREHDGSLETLVSDPAVLWADGVARGPDGALWWTDSAIPAYIDPWARPPSLETLVAHRPYRLLRLPSTRRD